MNVSESGSDSDRLTVACFCITTNVSESGNVSDSFVDIFLDIVTVSTNVSDSDNDLDSF